MFMATASQPLKRAKFISKVEKIVSDIFCLLFGSNLGLVC